MCVWKILGAALFQLTIEIKRISLQWWYLEGNLITKKTISNGLVINVDLLLTKITEKDIS